MLPGSPKATGYTKELQLLPLGCKDCCPLALLHEGRLVLPFPGVREASREAAKAAQMPLASLHGALKCSVPGLIKALDWCWAGLSLHWLCCPCREGSLWGALGDGLAEAEGSAQLQPKLGAGASAGHGGAISALQILSSQLWGSFLLNHLSIY